MTMEHAFGRLKREMELSHDEAGGFWEISISCDNFLLYFTQLLWEQGREPPQWVEGRSAGTFWMLWSAKRLALKTAANHQGQRIRDAPCSYFEARSRNVAMYFYDTLYQGFFTLRVWIAWNWSVFCFLKMLCEMSFGEDILFCLWDMNPWWAFVKNNHYWTSNHANMKNMDWTKLWKLLSIVT